MCVGVCAADGNTDTDCCATLEDGGCRDAYVYTGGDYCSTFTYARRTYCIKMPPTTTTATATPTGQCMMMTCHPCLMQ